MLRRRNEALPGLVGGILLYGLCLQLVGVWFVQDKAGYSFGVWFGAALAVGQAIHIATVILDSVSLLGKKHAGRRIAAMSVLRYAVVVALAFLFGYFRPGNLPAMILGLLGLKISAYLQPILGKIRKNDSKEVIQ